MPGSVAITFTSIALGNLTFEGRVLVKLNLNLKVGGEEGGGLTAPLKMSATTTRLRVRSQPSLGGIG